eukprot:TRINITY_DN4115_c0_g1_i1.p1 TRINITY_DN4115_c0_g1~~TRINITY_DN4115_c0_g1_i1.p1  ORF type:complete len:753 (-),score=112.51 TRINITY_DN4115_c0_g1_i1:81-2339(-)
MKRKNDKVVEQTTLTESVPIIASSSPPLPLSPSIDFAKSVLQRSSSYVLMASARLKTIKCTRAFFSVVVLVLIMLASKINHPPIQDFLPSDVTDTLNSFLGDAPRPGTAFAEAQFQSFYPVVFVPGIISTSLQLWKGEPCAGEHFRERIWGSYLMFQSMLFDTQCWLRHVELDPETGLDPPGIKLRPAVGLEAADYFVGSYFVWSKIIESLADIGYDPNNMFMASYDWRLSYPDLEKRDHYFTKLKSMIEIAKISNNNRKVVLICHSMGSSVLHFFLKWVESAHGGNAGPNWVNDNINSIIYIGSALLGVSKSISSLISGEMKDTADMLPFISYLRTSFMFSNLDVVGLMKATRSVPASLLKGGVALWGDHTGAPDDVDGLEELIQNALAASDLDSMKTNGATHDNREELVNLAAADCALPTQKNKEVADRLCATKTTMPESLTSAAISNEHLKVPVVGQQQKLREEGEPRQWDAIEQVKKRKRTNGNVLSFAEPIERFVFNPDTETGKRHPVWINMTELNAEEAIDFLRTIDPKYMKMVDSLYSFGLASNPSLPQYDNPRYWSNPLESQLPRAPNLTIYAFNGVDSETERAYVFKNSEGTFPEIPFDLDTRVTIPDEYIRNGIRAGVGDGTVQLLSLGFMPARGWKEKRFNPGDVQIVLREFVDTPLPRGRPIYHRGQNFMRKVTSAHHIDMMGNYELISDILRIVAVRPLRSIDTNETGHISEANSTMFHERVGERIHSKIQEISSRVKL